MGYNASFSFDLKISADKVAEMEKRYFVEQQKDDDPDYKPGDFCKHFNSQWGEDLCHEEAPAPLEALASGETRGDIFIFGEVYGRWGSWCDALMESIEEFIQDGGEVAICGEDGFKTNWTFDEGVMVTEDEEYIRVSRREELEGKEKELELVKTRLTKAEDLLTEHLMIAPLYGNGLTKGKLNSRIKDFLKEPSALEQLAEQTE